jgi:hypothetical protein
VIHTPGLFNSTAVVYKLPAAQKTIQRDSMMHRLTGMKVFVRVIDFVVRNFSGDVA